MVINTKDQQEINGMSGFPTPFGFIISCMSITDGEYSKLIPWDNIYDIKFTEGELQMPANPNEQ